MLKNEKGISYVNWVIIVAILLVFMVIVIRAMVGENGLLNQMKEERQRNQLENNIVIELANSVN